MSRFICCYTQCCYAEYFYAESHYAECHYAKCHVLFVVFLVILNIVAPVPVQLVEQSNHDPESEGSNPPTIVK
jgi:hypothetical protein